MPPLKNPKHEAFVQLLLQGESAIDAHERVGFARSDANSSRLKSHPKVAERLAELQGEIAGENKITVASLLDELEDARKRADSLDMLSAVVKAISEKAKIAGLMAPQKLEIGQPGSFDKCTTAAEVVDELLKYSVNPHVAVDERDRRALVEMHERHYAETEQFLAALNAKPVTAQAAYSQRRAELERLGNGKGRP